MNSSSDEKAFDEYLGRRSRVSRAYRELPADDVPAHLDEQILAQARTAISAADDDELAHVRAKRRRLIKWSVPAAIAASALLVVSIVIRSGVEHEVTSADFQLAKPAPATAPPAAARQETSGRSVEESVVMIAPPPDAVTEFSPYARPPLQPRSDAAIREEPVIAAPPLAVNMPAPAPAAPVAAMQERTAAAAASREMETQRTVAARRQEAAKAASAPALSRMSGIAESANTADAALSVARLHADPEDWLEHIRQLRRDGQHAAADREWKQFQETWPDHPVAETDLARTKPDDR